MEETKCPNCGKEVSKYTMLCEGCKYPLFIDSAESYVAKVKKISFALNFNMVIIGLLMILGSTVVPVYYFGIEDVKVLAPLMMFLTFPGAIFFTLGLGLFFLKFLLNLWRNNFKVKLLKRFGFHNALQNIHLGGDCGER